MSKLPIADKDEKSEQAEGAVASFKNQRGKARTREQITTDAIKTLAKIRKDREAGLEHYPILPSDSDDRVPAFNTPEEAMAHVLAGGKLGVREPLPEEPEEIGPREVEPDGIT